MSEKTDSFKQWFEQNVLSVTTFAIGTLIFIITIDFREQSGPILGEYLYDVIVIGIITLLLAYEKKGTRGFSLALQELLTLGMRTGGDLSETTLLGMRNWLLNNIINELSSKGQISNLEKLFRKVDTGG